MVLFNRHVASDEKFDEHNMTLTWTMIGYPADLEVLDTDVILKSQHHDCCLEVFFFQKFDLHLVLGMIP